MKIGVLCDIHGNLSALEAVIRALAARGCDEIIGTGDVLTIGPESVACLHLLQRLPNFCMVSGNHERCFDHGFAPPYPPHMLEHEAAHHQFVYDRLSEADKQWLRALPRRMERRFDCGSSAVTVLFVHYPMDREGAFLPNFRITPEAMDEAYAIIGQLDAYALKLAMPKMTDADIDRMSVAIEKIDLSIEKRNYELYCSWQEEFHLIYLEICGNQTLIDLIKELERRNIRTTYFSADTEKLFAFLKIINEQHRELLKWIIEKNEEKAAEMIAKHWTMEF